MAISWPTDGQLTWGGPLRTGLVTLEGVAAGNYGPNWVAASNAPSTVKAAVSGAGGKVCDGTADQVEINSAIGTYGQVELTQGDFNLSASITTASRRSIKGQGMMTRLVGATGLTGAFIMITHDNFWVRDLVLAGGSEATGTHHIWSNVTSTTGFFAPPDSIVQVHNIFSLNSKGMGIRTDNGNNRASKWRNIRVFNSAQQGFYANSDCPDGQLQGIDVGSAGSHGVEINGANWVVNQGQSWYSDGDGWKINGIRSIFSNVSAQDNMYAGFRIIGNNHTISNWLADSNSYDGATPSGQQNVHSGMEIGRNFDGTTASNSGGFDITVGPGMSYDKSESGRGYNQRSGVRLRSSLNGLIMTGVNTGGTIGGTASHRNVTAGIEFDNAADLTNSQNFVSGCLNGHVRMSSV